jgi:uncharacterized peroxidase-related enzyme
MEKMMRSFTVHTIETAPERSRPDLQGLQEQAGFVPNLAAAMAESPELLRGFLAVRDVYQAGTLTPGEIQVLSLTAAFENGCVWCMAFHTFMALQAGVSPETVEALRTGASPREPRLRTLSDFARAMLGKRGNVAERDLAAFYDAGLTPAQAMEVVLGMAFSLMANYAGHLADVPLDPPFQPHAWQRAEPFATLTA